MTEKYTVLNEAPIESGNLPEQNVTGGSILHKNLRQNNSYTPGSCSNNDSVITSSYMDFSPLNDCSSFASNPPQEQNEDTCSSYWSKKIKTTINDVTSENYSTANNRQLHWLNGGYFYGMSEYRKYIEKELGTIHFSNTIKYDVVYKEPFSSTEIGTAYLPQFYLNTQQQFKILSDYDSYTKPYMFNISNVFRSINNFYNLPQKDINALTPEITYNSNTGKYESFFSDSPVSINNCGYSICPVIAKPENAFEPNQIYVSLSNGNITYFPLTNENINSNFHHNRTFLLTAPLGLESYPIDIITPTSSVYDLLQNYVGSVNNTSFNTYFISNAPKSSYGLTTTSVSLAKSETEFYNNHKFRVYLDTDTSNSEKINLFLDNNILGSLVNEYNEDSGVTDVKALLKDIISYMQTTYNNIPLTVSLYKYIFNEDGTISLDKTANILGDGAILVSVSDVSLSSLEIRLNPEKDIILKNLNITQPGESYMMMIKASTYLVGFNNNTNIKDLSKPGILAIDKTNNTQIFNPVVPSNTELKYNLFNEDSSRFSTPDYSSIQKFDKKIPLRGSEYTDSESSNYPILRYVRKPDGRFFIQVLAGAFPYYHSLVHYPVTKHLTPFDQETPVEKSLKEVCSKTNQWYNHVATTKWTCFIKHTEFGSDYTTYTNTEADKSSEVAPQSSVVGAKPPGTKPKAPQSGSIYEGGGIAGGGGGLNRPGDGITIELDQASPEDEQQAIE